MKDIVVTLFLALVLLASCQNQVDTIDLAGEWEVSLDSLNTFTNITLPGTTDGAGLGIPNELEPELAKPQLTHLTRKNSFIGSAFYKKEITIPSDWDGKEVFLNLERVLWRSDLWVDGVKVEGMQASISAPQQYSITDYIVAGKTHEILLKINNRKMYEVSNDLAHAYTDHTQIKWNGVLGDITLEAKDRVYISDVQLYPDVDNKRVKAVVRIKNTTGRAIEGSLDFKAFIGGQSFTVNEKLGAKGDGVVELFCELGENPVLWSEFEPTLYNVEVSISSDGMQDKYYAKFGMRKLERRASELYLNDKPLFLRGTLECCIFPLTGTPPMDKAGWLKVFGAAKEYGLNHIRFHSWCPPSAAFEAADEIGFYLQAELPAWILTIGENQEAVDFLNREADRIMASYGNHPSFVMWSLGNELQGDFDLMGNMVKSLKARDSRHLYTTTSFTFEKGHGSKPEPNDDFFITQWTDNGWVRGQGIFNQKSPSFDKDYEAPIKGFEVPLITHEIGQYSVYPNVKEIEKYTGVLEPLNFIAIKNDLIKKGLINKAEDYLQASGQLSAILYKEEIERALKTKGLSGFQLLDLHDFPGQGAALVGLLDAFWDSKGIITGEEFRQFCSPVVPLALFPKATYTNDEKFVASIDVCNYGASELNNANVEWVVSEGDRELEKGSCVVSKLTFGSNEKIGDIDVELASVSRASELQIEVSIKGTEYRNSWKIWVYPKNQPIEYGDVAYTRNYDEASKLLTAGKKVLFNPDWKATKGMEGKFVPVFWSPVHFPRQAGSMGLLCNVNSGALSEFPTDFHSDWQWWDLVINSVTLNVDSLKGGNAIVETVDNFTNNRRLASLFEGSVGKGKLVVCTFDLHDKLDERPVAKQLLKSVLDYMNEEEFAPVAIENWDSMRGDFCKNEKSKKGVATDIY